MGDAGVEDEPVPKVTPSLLAAAETMCERRLHEEFTCAPGTRDPFNRGRVRESLIDAIRAHHESGAPPLTPAHLEAEEQRVFEHAIAWYPRLFADGPGALIETPLGEPTELPRRGVRLGGLVGLCVVRADGQRELRHLELGASSTPDDPIDLPAVRLTVLRLAQERWVERASLTVVWADLLTGIRRESVVQVPDDLQALATWLDDRLAVVHTRLDAAATSPGRDCTMCRYVPRCPEHELRGSMMTKRGDRFPAVLVLSPTKLDSWRRCRRELGSRALSVPPSDPEGGTAHGLYLHSILRFVHEHGSCRDTDRVAEVLAIHGADERVADEVRRHVTKCPVDAESIGHEVEWVRTNPAPPTFLASARLDAVWRHGDVLEIRDYKTGQRGVDSLADDPRARLQAWVAARRSAAEDLRLRLRYEYLSREVVEDPEAWEPDAEDLAAIDAELRAVAADMRAERDWHGVADETVCRSCRYRSICPDSASPSEPAWPAITDVDEPAEP